MGVHLNAVGKRYGPRQPWVVRDVSLEMAPGQLIRLQGRNGSGKSTLLKVLAGVSLPSAGRVTGRPHAGYVPERFPGELPFPARDYLLHMARTHGLRGAACGAAVNEWLERLGAAEYAQAPLRNLSKGMCQKVAIAQALLARPGLLVLDEAWTGLDQAARATLDVAVAERIAEGGMVLFVDHDPARLAGQASQRWQLGSGGRLTVVPGDHEPPSGTPGPAGGTVVVIEVDGLAPESAQWARGLPGVLACDGRAVRVAAARSDEVLRTVLSWDGVHVRGVHAEGGPR
jgi:ABC-2 type transport system ATP-binding protein